MKRTFAALGVVGLGLISVTAPAMAAPERVIVCHSDGGSWKPLEFNVNGLAGHDQHPLDIIPPTSTSPGKNWTDAGKLLYADKCAALPPGETLPEVNPPADEVDPPADQVDPPADQVDPPADQVDPPADQVDPPADQVDPPAGEVDPPPVETPTDTPVIDPPGEQPVVVEQTGTEQPTAGTSAQTPAAEQPATAVPAAAQAKTDKQQGRPTAVTGASPAASSLGTNQGYNAQTAIGGSESAPSWLAGLGALAAAGAAVALRRRTRPFTPAG
ncbi:hypothetical protein CXX84_09605 [Arthrobacter sp. AFG7.2]|uniref:hypothetical protein n=1 Tax=Arthrobacter sp. AFG7.2 TaxID=1688693 RepID=UPI000C9E902A|nr:hypothetical protein [Arthrobacter sp. AFG7.2]PNI08827.1 hypothetical protein CXX84_09605 [Arthrobacter sp. AFG7.2]